MNTSIDSLGIVLFAGNRERLPNGTIIFDTVEPEEISSKEFRIRNRSDVEVTITNISLLIATAYTFVGLPVFPITLQPDEETTFEIEATSAVEIEEMFDYLKIESSVAGAPLDYRLMTDFAIAPVVVPPGGGDLGMVVSAGANIETPDQGEITSEDELSGGLVLTGQLRDFQFTIFNGNSTTLSISSIVLGAVEYNLEVGTPPFAIAPGDVQLFDIRFTAPGTPGAYPGLVTINNDGIVPEFVFTINMTVSNPD